MRDTYGQELKNNKINTFNFVITVGQYTYWLGNEECYMILRRKNKDLEKLIVHVSSM